MVRGRATTLKGATPFNGRELTVARLLFIASSDNNAGIQAPEGGEGEEGQGGDGA